MLAHLAAFAALLPAATAPVIAAPAVPAPADVTLAWASDAHQAVVLTWHEDGDYADRVSLTDVDGKTIGSTPSEVPAGRPDQLTLPTSSLPVNQNLRFSVQPVDAGGQPLGDPATSPAFDTDQPPQPVLVNLIPRTDGSVEMFWQPAAYLDETPDDPLDLPASPVGYYPLVSRFDFNEYDHLTTGPITSTSFLVPASRPLPEVVAVQSTPNEFGRNTGEGREIQRTDLKVSIPRTAITGRPLQVTGTARRTIRACDPGPCGTVSFPMAGRLLELEARTGPDSIWRTVATTRTAVKTGSYKFRITSPGTRDYRVVAEASFWRLGVGDNNIFSYAATAVVTTHAGTASGSQTGGGGGLPITGAPVAWIAAAGALLAALGAGLMLAARRRKPTTV